MTCAGGIVTSSRTTVTAKFTRPFGVAPARLLSFRDLHLKPSGRGIDYDALTVPDGIDFVVSVGDVTYRACPEDREVVREFVAPLSGHSHRRAYEPELDDGAPPPHCLGVGVGGVGFRGVVDRDGGDASKFPHQS